MSACLSRWLSRSVIEWSFDGRKMEMWNLQWTRFFVDERKTKIRPNRRSNNKQNKTQRNRTTNLWKTYLTDVHSSDERPFSSSSARRCKEKTKSLSIEKCFLSFQCISYHKIITRPIDLGTIKGKLNSYTSFNEFLSDVRLMFQNCATFNRVRFVFQRFFGRIQTSVLRF